MAEKMDKMTVNLICFLLLQTQSTLIQQSVGSTPYTLKSTSKIEQLTPTSSCAYSRDILIRFPVGVGMDPWMRSFWN